MKGISTIKVDISPAELVDKITILEIKTEQINDPTKLVNVKKELNVLRSIYSKHFSANQEFNSLVEELKKINKEIWDSESLLRLNKDNTDVFLKETLKSHNNNDIRFGIKRKINTFLNSAFVEEKSYKNLK